jgi:hypothetical protein
MEQMYFLYEYLNRSVTFYSIKKSFKIKFIHFIIKKNSLLFFIMNEVVKFFT